MALGLVQRWMQMGSQCAINSLNFGPAGMDSRPSFSNRTSDSQATRVSEVLLSWISKIPVQK